MRPDARIPIDIMTERLKLLPRRLRVVHLRALAGSEFPDSVRRSDLAALLRNEMMAQVAKEGGLA